MGHDCAGMEAPSQAVRNLGVSFTSIFASDIDKFACQTIEANFRPIKFYRGEVDGDIAKRDHSQAPGCDLYAAGFPCQPHSSEGNKRGFEDPRGQVFYSVVDYMRTHKPRVAVLENVRSLLHNRDGADICEVLHQLLRLDCYNIQWRVLNTADHGVPQNRNRLYIVCIRKDFYIEGRFQWPDPIACPSVERFLDPCEAKPTLLSVPPPPQTFTSEIWGATMAKLLRDKCEPLQQAWLFPVTTSVGRCSVKLDTCPCLLTRNKIWISNRGRLLNARERCRLQGMNPDHFKQVVSDAQWRKQLGNAMSINVVERLLARLLPAVGLTGPLPDRWASGTAAAELEATRASA